MATLTKNERLELRLPGSQKGMFEAAATSKGLNLTQWALSVLTGAARQDLEEARVTTLAARDFDAFSAALDEPIPEAACELLERTPVWEG